MQCGLRGGRSCVDQIFSIRLLDEKCLGVKKKIFCTFMDLEKDYDRVDRNKLWEVMVDDEIEGVLLNVVEALYDGCMMDRSYGGVWNRRWVLECCEGFV